jgi:hypothetical protein
MNQPSKLSLPIEFGNAGAIDTHGSGWFIGFSDWSKLEPHNLRYMPRDSQLSGLCVKWFAHSAGDPDGEEKPISTGRTMSVLISDQSDFRIDFSSDPKFSLDATETFRLQFKGDFVIWGAGVFHRTFGRQASTIMTIRWET